MNEDESLSFFCAIDKGIVLTVAKGTDLLRSIESLFDQINVEIGPPQLVIGCDCILRARTGEKQLKDEAGYCSPPTTSSASAPSASSSRQCT